VLGAVVVAPGDVVPEPEREPDVVVSVDVDGDVAVGGDADGVRSPGRSLVRGVPLSVQPAASAATSASAEMLDNALFMNAPPDGVANRYLK
jgi:hypothetical protein